MSVFCVLSIFQGSASYAQRSSNDKKQPTKVLVQPVSFSANTRVFEAVGTGRAKLSADIYPSLAEEVISINFKAQDKVSKGDVLVQLDDRAEKLAVQLAEVELKDAQSLLDRYQKAGKAGAVPQSEVDSSQATHDGAIVALEQAKLNLEDRQIIAPFDGVVGIPNVDPGDRVDSSTLITGLDARDVLYVDFEVPEALAGALQTAQNNNETVNVTTPSFAGKTFKGYIIAQESRINAQTRTVKARASIDNSDDLLRPGMSFNVKWSIPGDRYASVPEISLQWGRDGSFVWLVRDNKSERVAARVVARKAGQVLVDGEIKDGESVVVEGLQRVRPSGAVEIINSDTAEDVP